MENSSSNRILVLENQGIDRRPICHYLEDKGFEIVTASSCHEALKIVEEQPVQTLIMETQTEDINSLDFIINLRKCHNLAELPIIVVSSLSEYADKVSAWNAGANYYIIKPVGQEELVAKVNLCLALHKSYQYLHTQEERLELAVKATNGGVFD